MSTVTALEVLIGAGDLVASGWCQNAMARNAEGEPVDAWNPGARAWSAEGAVLAAWRRSCPNTEELDRSIACFVHANLALAGSVPTTPNRWNNARGRRKEQVVRALARATALLEWPQPTEAVGITFCATGPEISPSSTSAGSTPTSKSGAKPGERGLPTSPRRTRRKVDGFPTAARFACERA